MFRGSDEEVLIKMQPWKEHIDETGKVVVGRTVVDLTKSDCGDQECNLGNFFCDAMVHSVSLTFFLSKTVSSPLIEFIFVVYGIDTL